MNPNRKRYLEHHHQPVSGYLIIDIVSEKLKPTYYILRNFLRIGFLLIVALIAYVIFEDRFGTPGPIVAQEPGKGWIIAPMALIFIFVLYFGPIIMREKSAFINIIGSVQLSHQKCIIILGKEKTEYDMSQISELYFDYSGFLGEVSVVDVAMRAPNPTFSGVENYLSVTSEGKTTKVKLFINTEYQADYLRQIIKDTKKHV